jgi:DNA invertase Pin-like site-specific DNA recombinase
MRLIGYARVSTDAQGVSGNGLEAQEASIRQYASNGVHEIIGMVVEVASGGKTDRPLLAGALEALRKGEADGLIVSKLDRATRSLRHFTELVEVAKKRKWSLIVVEGGFDMTTPTGRAMAGMLAVFAELERDMISTRTREALEAKKRRQGGKLKGNKASANPVVVARICELRKTGFTYRAIAGDLESRGIPTAQGGKWRPGTVRYILEHAA